MFLKKNIELVKFLGQVNKCKEDILFCTNEGDLLNLKSTLSQLVFASIADKPEILYSAEIKVKREEDYQLLKDYLIG
ncbi:MAG TPA: hypothetical protein GXX75_02755 [Clostridiales bacterium]|nr:hypothetical protein [Clostridiales bacterium]